MVSKISGGIKISVEAFYQQEFSNPMNNEFMFAYRIFIENNNIYPVQLISRHWYIFDSIGSMREVQGDGVVGEQPLLKPSEKFEYMSGCNLRSDMGRMHGTYLFKNVNYGSTFTVQVPAFEMIAEGKLN